jgi:hypothetical protein
LLLLKSIFGGLFLSASFRNTSAQNVLNVTCGIPFSDWGRIQNDTEQISLVAYEA